MKRISILVLAAAALCVNACERKPAAELPPEHATAFGEHAWPPTAGGKHGDHAPAAKPHTPAAASEGAGGDAPKFFPDKK